MDGKHNPGEPRARPTYRAPRNKTVSRAVHSRRSVRSLTTISNVDMVRPTDTGTHTPGN